MEIRRGKDLRDVYVSQPKLTQDLIDNYLDEQSPAMTPAVKELIENIDPINTFDCQAVDKSKYLRLIMKLMYLARFTRPDILFPVTFLSSKSQNPNVHDWKQAIRVVRYLKGTKTHGIHIHVSDFSVHAHCDASYGIHADGKGHTGFIISLGKRFGFLLAKSFKQSVGSLSSTDAEILATASCAKTIEWIRNLISELNVESLAPTIIYQDNKSSIIMSSNTTNYKRVKHQLTKIGYIKTLHDLKQIEFFYLGTEFMTADMLTKPLSFIEHSKHIKACGVVDLSYLF